MTDVSIPNYDKNNMPKTTKSAVLEKVFDIDMKDTKLKEMGPTDVLIKVVAVGICGSDVHYYDQGHIGNFVVKKPLILGHESSGVIVAVGDKVTKFKRGDRVAMEPGVPCGHCEACRTGHYNLCPNMQFMATPPVNGDLTQFIVYPQDFVYPIPENVSYEEATLNEPLSVGVHATQKLGVDVGSSVLISGMGPIGLLAILAAKAHGADQIIVSDAEQSRLDVAKKLGATNAVNIKNADVLDTVKTLTNGVGVDYAIEASGTVPGEQTSLHALKRGGKVAYIGVPTTDQTPLDVPFMTDHETTIMGIFRYCNNYQTGLKILAKNTKLVDNLLTNFYPLDQTKAALEKSRTDKSNSIKVIIYPNEQLRK
ncbi:NAD(P)-dependent alcohol dehydrogenase [Fructilactobacillus fructivorans]|uniref:Sorbitol dehydrogenase n=1 Tax=Fructilactobacillus fructivorans TaxID=1614 RepID=A0A0C1LYK6_9LACO|nr:NAD(P)-dependent alcohol dehydrogenase [Fructilactobacillus fructivorans]KID41965.1 Sorbitol dehydrogenase [Fructilactobacillus fructivorans]MCT0151622.1 NAD(P)-dependent alcohol dehydrogenase [Fructilactobacillus fructivorans]MCT2867249.1 NAD(P)-dependent alcohol dehydrogenase [Fructilactobacillus fructivorans]MCT2868190.1 NAD(P)-dependent alcohol dehydrogenase [Fructilactobacillus fructivorans]MCT2872898.1 NAD(P)-dependent alcohol dehydrogenase [Fructilactobacillus fructivorans]